ncbi:MAG: DUF1553 domain-containing protein [Verrucomicrobiales bacterium]|nr:DUF1553 domain-containing protein [Verrucomicrobiales bacterium]
MLQNVFLVTIALIVGASAEPVAHWSFEPADSEVKFEGKVVFVNGPNQQVSRNLPSGNRAAQFDGKGSFVRLSDSESLRFDQGDPITIEAWIKLDGKTSTTPYIIGKGRLSTDKENQNWALRLMKVGSQYRVSFLFRSHPFGHEPEAFHRWNSDLGIAPGKLWHHVAVRYRFGKPDSVTAFVNGKKSAGTWDLGGETTRPPIVDDAEVWVGSSRGGETGNSWRGALDEVAVHRELLSDEILADRVDFGSSLPAVDWNLVNDNAVRVEVFDDLAEGHSWPERMVEDPASFEVPAMALCDLPPRYVQGGSRERRRATLIRMATYIELCDEPRELLLRAPSLARLFVNGEVITKLESYQMGSHAHQLMRPAVAETPYPRARLGTRDVLVRLPASSGRHEVILEAVVGRESIRFSLGELLVACRKIGDSAWHLVTSPTGEPREFSPTGMEAYRQGQAASFVTLADERRQRLRVDWKQRQADARAYIDALAPIALPDGIMGATAIDHFLAAKINDQPQAVHPGRAILREHCTRCHGSKAKGDLRLNTREAAIAGGETGVAAIVPGSPHTSAIMRRILSRDLDERMPPKGKRLTGKEVDLLEAWITKGAPWNTVTERTHIPPPLDDATFLRRLYLDTVGIFPTTEDIKKFKCDESDDRTERWVKKLIKDHRHADHWTSYWQDVLAENPRLVKGKLNNTGPFRWWIYEALRDKLPFDQFVSELIALQGSPLDGGAAGFKIATENDAPAAAKAHVIATAFLGTEMKCARCHDAPYHQSTQKDLFGLAAMLEGKPLKVPKTSTVPLSFFKRIGDRESKVKMTLEPGTPVEPAWPFGSSVNGQQSSQERLAWELTRPQNHRFTQVIVNRVWQRYFGQGFVEPASDWEGNEPSHPQLLDYLARDFIAHGYDLDRLSILILTSDAYRREAELEPTKERLFEAPLKRRLSAEQLVDSLFAATGVPIYSEELTLDVPGTSSAATFQNLGRPTRAWHFVSLASDRDRPSLTLPRADSIVSVMKAFGWRPDRSEPITVREMETTVLQPGMLANGVFATWITRLSPFSDLTKLAIEADTPHALANELYSRFLSRDPVEAEQTAILALLSEGFESRLARPACNYQKAHYVPEVREVTWSNHLSPEANFYAAETERQVELGPPATAFLNPAWRTRMEDAIWAIINAPEMQYTP